MVAAMSIGSVENAGSARNVNALAPRSAWRASGGRFVHWHLVRLGCRLGQNCPRTVTGRVTLDRKLCPKGGWGRTGAGWQDRDARISSAPPPPHTLSLGCDTVSCWVAV